MEFPLPTDFEPTEPVSTPISVHSESSELSDTERPIYNEIVIEQPPIEHAFTMYQEWVTSGPIPGPGTTPTMFTSARLTFRSLLSQNQPGTSQQSPKTEIDQSWSQNQYPGEGQSTAPNGLRQPSSRLSSGDICRLTLLGRVDSYVKLKSD